MKMKMIKVQTLLKIATITAGFILLYHHTITKLIHDWSTDDNFSHGFLVPVIAGYMIWHYRERFLNIAVQPSLWGGGDLVGWNDVSHSR